MVMNIRVNAFLIICICLLISHRSVAQLATESVYYTNDSLPLAGLLFLPSSDIPLPAAVIIQGAGTSDRSNQWSEAIARAVAEAGFAVLLTDKRGSGESGGDWRTAGFGELAEDVLAAFTYLQARDEVDEQRVGLIGLSQGGWVAPIAAARQPQVAFVINISGATVTFAEQIFAELTNTVRQAGLGDTATAQILAINRAAGDYIHSGDWESYQQLRAAAASTPWAKIAAGFPDDPQAPVWTYLRKVIDFSPIPYWMMVQVPVLVMYGEEDSQDNVPVEESVHRLDFAYRTLGKTNYRIEVIPGTGHALMDREKQRLLPAFVEVLQAWLKIHAY